MYLDEGWEAGRDRQECHAGQQIQENIQVSEDISALLDLEEEWLKIFQLREIVREPSLWEQEEAVRDLLLVLRLHLHRRRRGGGHTDRK